MSQSGYEGQSLCTYSYHPSLAPCQTVTIMLRSLSSVAVTHPTTQPLIEIAHQVQHKTCVDANPLRPWQVHTSH